MPMNEFGEIVRSDGSSNTTGSSSVRQTTGNTDQSTRDIEEQFIAAKKRNFNLITLCIGVPLYSIIGYYVAEYYKYEDVTGITGALLGGMIALICILIFNNALAKTYQGFEYCVSLLSAVIALAIVALAILAIYIVVSILAAIIGIVIVIAIIGGLLGG